MATTRSAQRELWSTQRAPAGPAVLAARAGPTTPAEGSKEAAVSFRYPFATTIPKIWIGPFRGLGRFGWTSRVGRFSQPNLLSTGRCGSDTNDSW